ncbi:hypothetical protein OIU74_001237 [Salix koriyanagi]|uniref:Uncharacterized protein n=1 Tax=Salix koriyanagi TaxID=2511006 RepID=A0A9Q0X4M7_9ROSI|nr:hypothetical protein OIU74_001237 [Salix koriyanagi]
MEIIISKLSTVTLLEPSTGTTSTKLLRLAPSWIRYKQSSIVRVRSKENANVKP